MVRHVNSAIVKILYLDSNAAHEIIEGAFANAHRTLRAVIKTG